MVKMNKKTIALIFALFVSLAGMYLSAYLTDVHYKLENNQEVEETLPCTLHASFDCDKVNSSVYSEVFGIPIALLGFFFYAAVFGVVIFALWKPAHAEVPLIVTHGLTIFSIFFSIYLFYIAKFVIGALCPYCIMMYGVNAGLFITTKISVGKTYAEKYALLQAFVIGIFKT